MERLPKVITITGLPNAGKSTVARLLAESLPRTVRIELDSSGVGHISKTLSKELKSELQQRGIIVEIEDAATLAVNWIDRGFDVLLVGLFNQQFFDYLKAYLNARLSDIEYHAFALVPPLAISLGSRGARTPDDQEQTFIRSLAGWFTPYGYEIDNQEQSPVQTAKVVMAELMSKTSVEWEGV